MGGGIVVLAADLADAKAADGLVARASEALGGLDILVNNAGITRDNLALRMKDEEWSEVLRVDLEACFRLSRSALRGMMRQRYGRIVNVTSVVGVTGNPGQANYAAAKAGVAGMSKSLALEIAARGVTVNCVAPGFVDTAMTRALNEQQRARILSAIPAARLGSGDEVAACVAFSGERPGGLYHRPDDPRKRRHGHGLGRCRACGRPRIAF